MSHSVDPSALAALGQLGHNSTIKPEVLAALAQLSHNDFGTLRMSTVTVRVRFDRSVVPYSVATWHVIHLR
eukprot:scaffold2473_cov247-Pinguiococcus_pyrenoidosus.AAC.15